MQVKNVEEGQRVKGTVYEVKDNEAIVDIGYTMEGTVHLERLTARDVESAHDVVKEGDEIETIVTRKDDDSGILLLSRVEIEKEELFEELQNKFENNETIEVKVLESLKGGLKVRSHGFDMFMPRRQIEDKPADDLKSYVGQTLSAKIIEIGRQRNRIRIVVSRRAVERARKEERKQEELANINVGDVLEGTVVKLMDYGAFVRFEEAECLLHVSEISHHRIKHPQDALEVGQKVKVKVIAADGDKRSLSMKALEPSPWEKFAETYSVGDKVQGKVVKKLRNGILVEVAKGVAGIVHRNDYSWNPRFNLAGNVQEGDEVEVKILSIDTENRKMRLSKKHLEYNPWQDVDVKVGDTVTGEIKDFQPQGALVEVQGVEAFLPISEIREEHVEKVEDVFEKGQVINAIVLKFDREKWRMVISTKAYEKKRIQDEYKKHLRTEDSEEQSQTLGELFADKLKDLKK